MASNRNKHPVPRALAAELRRLAAEYETEAFMESDPIGCVGGACRTRPEAIESAAFVAASLSYGSRTQFLPKIRWLGERAGGNIHDWVLSGRWRNTFHADDPHSFYRVFSCGMMHAFFSELQRILRRHGSLGACLRAAGVQDGSGAVRALVAAFGGRAAPVVPKDASSACKRLCMFVRWMARDDSPVDFGLWSAWLDKSTLLIPLDVHVLRQACRLGLLDSRTATMRTAERLTACLSEVFPGDPCKGDFALYGLGSATERKRNSASITADGDRSPRLLPGRQCSAARRS